MGCKNSKTLKSDENADLSADDIAAVRRLSAATQEDILDPRSPIGPGKGFGSIARRDSIQVNRKAIEKRKKNVAGEGGPTREGMRRPLPRAFMKPGSPQTPVTGKFKGSKLKKRRDSIAVNKEKMARKKQQHQRNGSAPDGMKVEVVPGTPEQGSGKKTVVKSGEVGVSVP